MCLISLCLFVPGVIERYRALFCTDNALLDRQTYCFCLRFSDGVIDVIDVIGTFAFGGLAFGSSRTVSAVASIISKHDRFCQ